MKKIYQQPAIREVKIQRRQHLLAGSPYNINDYKDGGEETVKDDGDWD